MTHGRADHFRAFARQPVDYAAEVRAQGRIANAKLINLGLGGACLELDTDTGESALGLGAVIDVALSLPSAWQVIEIRATVVWAQGADPKHSPWLIGVEFQQLDAHATEQLLEVLMPVVFA